MLLTEVTDQQTKGNMKDNIVIVGGGIAGMEAARQLLRMGLNPIIVEKSDHLGGHVARWHRLFPDMTPANELVGGLIEATGQANIFLNTEISFMNRLKDSYNIMLSNGVSVIAKVVLITTGFSVFDASKKEEYGYGVYDQVMTNSDLEQWFNNGNDSRKFPDAAVYCFYMDLRMFGKKYEDFYISAQRDYGIRFIRGRVSEVSENIDGRVIVKAEDTLAGKPVKVTLDLLVLMSGMVCNRDCSSIAGMISLQTDSDGFFKSRDNISDIICSSREGIYYAGACTGPKTVPETLAEARSAALEIFSYINRA